MDNRLFRKLTTRTIRTNFKQFVSVILIVLLGVMLLSGFITNSYTFKRSIDRYFDETNMARTWLYVDGVNSSDREFFESNRISYDERLYLETNANITGISQTNNAKIYVSAGKISTPYIESGIAGCLIDKNVAKNNNISVTFDSIKFPLSYSYGGTDIELDLEFNISGTMNLDECADSYSAWPVFIQEDLFLNELNSKIASKLKELGVPEENIVKVQQMHYNQVLLTTDEQEVIDKVKAYYDTADSNLLYVLGRDSIESVVLLNSEINQSRKMIYVFPVIFLVVSILVILTTIDQLVLQEKQKIGTLKSIGIPDRKILRHYSKFGGILCAIGAIIGIILGVLVIPKIMFIKYNLVYSIPSDFVNLNVPFWWLILVFVGVVLLGYLVSLSSCYQVLHKKPIECLRFDVGTNSKAFKKNKGRFKKVPLSVKMATRNVRLKPMRTLMATLGIAGCVALLICGFGIGDTLKNSIANDYGRVFSYDVTSTYNTEDFEEKLQGLEGLKHYEKYERIYAEARNGDVSKNINVYFISENSAFTQFKLGEGEIFVSKSIADTLRVDEGSEISIKINGEEKQFKINIIGETSILNGIYIAGESGILPALKTTGVWLSADSPDDAVKFLNTINGTNAAKTMQSLKEDSNNKISSIDLMMNTLKFFAIMLAVVVLLNLIFLILKERTRELATLKVLGKDLIHITLSIYFEVLFMAIIGLIVGMCLGYPLMVLVLTVNKIEVVNFLFSISPVSFVYAALIVLLTQVAMTVFGYFKIKKINMIESLKSVE